MRFIKKFIRLFINIFKGNYRDSVNSFKVFTALYAFTLHFFKSSSKKQTKKAAVFFMKDGKKDRYVFSIINTFKIAGYDIFLKPKYSFYASCSGLYILNIFTYLKVGWFSSFKIIKRYDYKVFITDIGADKTPKGFNKYLYIDYKLALKKHKFTLPFPFHPLIYIDNKLISEKEVNIYLSPLRKSDSKINVTFGGAVFGETYNNLNKHFKGLLNRNEIFKHIFKTFNSKINTSANINNKLPITIIDTSKKYVIQHKDWMKFMCQSSFFIAPPGFEMPFSHNVIEAMACGVIPIIQYYNFFIPNLEHKKNCLVFNNTEELESVINYALSMSEADIEIMKNNVINYYTQKLSSSSFVNKIEHENKPNITISIISGIFSI